MSHTSAKKAIYNVDNHPKIVHDLTKNVAVGFCRFGMNKVVPIILHNFNLFWINVFDQFNLNDKYKFV